MILSERSLAFERHIPHDIMSSYSGTAGATMVLLAHYHAQALEELGSTRTTLLGAEQMHKVMLEGLKDCSQLALVNGQLAGHA